MNARIDIPIASLAGITSLIDRSYRWIIQRHMFPVFGLHARLYLSLALGSSKLSGRKILVLEDLSTM